MSNDDVLYCVLTFIHLLFGVLFTYQRALLHLFVTYVHITQKLDDRRYLLMALCIYDHNQYLPCLQFSLLQYETNIELYEYNIRGIYETLVHLLFMYVKEFPLKRHCTLTRLTSLDQLSVAEFSGGQRPKVNENGLKNILCIWFDLVCRLWVEIEARK